MKILDNFKPFLLSYFWWCQTFYVNRRALDPDPDQDPGWFLGSRASIECLTQIIKNTKKRTCKLFRKLIQWYFEYLSLART